MDESSSCSISGCDKLQYRKGYCQAHYRRLLRHGDPLAGGTFEGDPLRFINEVAMLHTSDECLSWPFSKGRNGYGQIRIDGKTATASRYVCELAHGAPPTPKHEAAHSCGKGHLGCISPGHLDWKTKTENQADRLVHGTLMRGERHGQAKLTENDVRDILALKGNVTQSKMAKRFGVTRQTISYIQCGKRRAWPTDGPSTLRSQSEPVE
ncbi:hypothetical protein FHT87_005225 [Rhizobium sp. BK316]|uniref:hypothetical protein n=1 Tax=Rhizobium sp. BK316 TaxID=2587053 RepID=UPI00160D2F4C|nr:hypothetical protein [Rhizobium sp. BK316]MBB3411272.1 hypothetical protein [Rhizobium sp. BK316]